MIGPKSFILGLFCSDLTFINSTFSNIFECQYHTNLYSGLNDRILAIILQTF